MTRRGSCMLISGPVWAILHWIILLHKAPKALEELFSSHSTLRKKLKLWVTVTKWYNCSSVSNLTYWTGVCLHLDGLRQNPQKLAIIKLPGDYCLWTGWEFGNGLPPQTGLLGFASPKASWWSLSLDVLLLVEHNANWILLIPLLTAISPRVVYKLLSLGRRWPC